MSAGWFWAGVAALSLMVALSVAAMVLMAVDVMRG